MSGDLDLAGVTVRPLTLAEAAPVTLVYCEDLLARDDLRRLVTGQLPGAKHPEELLHNCRQQADEAQVATTQDVLLASLLDGFVALHADGAPAATLVRSHPPGDAEHRFGHDLRANRALLRRNLRSASLRVDSVITRRGARVCVAYLAGVAAPKIVQAATAWAETLSPAPAMQPVWKQLLDLFRLPATVSFQSPVAAAERLKVGHVLIMADYLPDAHVAPPSLELLMSGPLDYTLDPPIRRFLRWPRRAAAATALLLGAFFVAITLYHHALLPGPFVAALAAQRQNLPFPIIAEIFLIHALDDAMWAGIARSGGRRWGVLACTGTMLGGLAAFQAGLLTAISAMVGIVAAVAFLLVPSQALAQRLRLWRILFCLVGGGLGVFGIALLLMVLLLYFGQEERIGHPVREEVHTFKSS
jgi:hypothetical protein